MAMFNARALLGTLALALAAAPSLGQTVTDFVCFASGLAGDCSAFTSKFCSEGSSIGVTADNSVSLCFNQLDAIVPFRCDFTAWRGATTSTSEPSSVFNAINCALVLNDLPVDCPMGGSGKVVGGEFFFTFQPNQGNCGDTTLQL